MTRSTVRLFYHGARRNVNAMTMLRVLILLRYFMFITASDIISTTSTTFNEPQLSTLQNETINSTSAMTIESGALSTNDDVTTLRPPSERRCFDGFECMHGVCLSPGTKFYCLCDEGWSGIVCHIPCQLDCGDNGICDVLDNGTAFCSCDYDYTGYLCEVKRVINSQTKDPQTSTVGPSASDTTADDSSCGSGFPCFHGHCPAGQLKCVCDDGWTGQFCGRACLLDCGERGTCSVVGGQQICHCELGYTGPKCAEKVTTPSVNTNTDEEPDTRSQLSVTPTATSTTSTSPSEDDLRPLFERQCVPGFVCKHGICPKGQLKCVCDEGWVGIFCHTPCTLDCGRYGQCVVTPAGQRCDCAVGFTGLKCASVVNITILEQSSLGPAVSKPTQTPKESSPARPEVTSSPFSITNATLRPLSFRQCVPGSSAFVCRHGACYKGPKNKTTIIGSVLECVCDPGWIGVFCHEACPLNCGDHGRCNVFKNGTVYCSCTHEYMGPRCEKVRPKPEPETHTPTWHWWVVGSCVFLLILLLILLIILPYLLWKRRFIFIMKIVYMFQPFEDDDDKLFDAFVSYKSTKLDEDFVVHTLYPKLEKSLNFKLCLHFRDFVPGETIANNIIHAVENSRRTIMILTPSYIQSEFCRFEYQRAQHEMLKRKQRIIPIVLQDISGDRMFMDETLRTILDTITYIEWPVDGSDKKVDKFWKRVELSMPKKRPSSSLSNNNDMTSDAYNNATSYSFPMFGISDTPQSDWSPREYGHANDSFADSGDDFHSIDINDDTDYPQPFTNGRLSNGVHNHTQGISNRRSSIS